ncbi:MAG: HAD-IIIC family phosphatase [Alphaproteobacteria bacterium]|nr:HAD-IIIC family phosphatase [Alphaproteobacteria bacterium]
MTEASAAFKTDSKECKQIKCVVWDLDDTLWQGTLLEGDDLVVTDLVRHTIVELDCRGVLQSIASKNDPAVAWDKLTALGLDEYFLYPQINWGNKSDSLRTIAEKLSIGLESLALVDDQPFERDEVCFHLSGVTVIDAAQLGGLLDMPALHPRTLTSESKQRRRMYQADIRRKDDEVKFDGARSQFLATLRMVVTLRRATEEDLWRAEELTTRTNQLNSTGRTYSREELHDLLQSEEHTLLIAELEDRYGSSGTVGLGLIERGSASWLLKLLIVSCRVVSRGVGSIMLTHILKSAARCGVRLQAEFVDTQRNRMMYITYKFGGFYEVGQRDAVTLLEHALGEIRPFPPHVTVDSTDQLGAPHTAE